MDDDEEFKNRMDDDYELDPMAKLLDEQEKIREELERKSRESRQTTLDSCLTESFDRIMNTP